MATLYVEMHPSGHVPLFPPNSQYPVPVFPVICSNIAVSSHPAVPLSFSQSISNVQSSNQMREREMNRKLKKKYLERRRRAKITNQTKAMYDLVFKMVGENAIRKTEICEMLGDCLTLMKYFYKVVEEDQILKSGVLPPGILSSSSSGRCIPMQNPVTSLEKGKKKENSTPNSFESAFSPVAADIPFVQTASTPMERESVDSGLEQSQLSTSSDMPNSSSSLFRESPSSKKSRITPDPHIWRPYLGLRSSRALTEISNLKTRLDLG
ncbi:hypothetical protein ACTXT7_005546 [Hymenolepis weldensis]